MDDKLVLKNIKTIIESGGKIIYTNHTIKRMAERKITGKDILNILNNPKSIKKHNESESVKGKYNYRITGYGTSFTVVVSPYLYYKLVIVTVID